MDQADEDLYKWYKKGTKDRSLIPEKYINKTDEELSEVVSTLNKVRNKAKSTSYSALYGIGKVKLAKELKISEKEAQQLLDGYWSLNVAVKHFTESIQTKTVRDQLWALNPGNGFYYSCRGTKDLFSTINQGFGSFIHVLWCKNMRQLGVKVRANFHDECVIVCKSGDEDRVSDLLLQAIDKTNKQARLKVPVKIDIQVGKNYGQIH
jgi:DNA polymerase-1